MKKHISLVSIFVLTACTSGSVQLESGKAICPAGTTALEDGSCQINNFVCPDGSNPNVAGNCVIAEAKCPENSTQDASGNCLAPKICPPGTVERYKTDGTSDVISYCVVIARDCRPGTTINNKGQCVRRSKKN